MHRSFSLHRTALHALIVAAVAGSLTAGGAAARADDRAAVPAAAELEAARKLLKEVFRQDYAKRGAAPQQALAAQLVRRAGAEQASSATRFVMLQEAASLYATAGKYKPAAEAIGQLEKSFAVEGLPLRTKALADAAPLIVVPADAAVAGEAALVLAEQAATARDYEAAGGDLSTTAEQLAARSKDKALLARARERTPVFKAARDESRLAAAAAKVLTAKPDDPQANLAVGRFLCLHDWQWEKGLPALAKSGDPGLSGLAKRELAGAAGAEARLELGEAWRALGAPQPPGHREGYDRRAAHWYKLALAESTGVMRTKVLQKINDLPGGAPFETLAAALANVKERGNSHPKEPGLLIGLHYSFANWGGHRVIKRMQPVWLTAGGKVTTETFGRAYSSEPKDQALMTVAAKPGYAVSAIIVDKTDRINGFKLVFMKVRGAMLDPAGSYQSQWVGDHVAKAKETLGGGSNPIVGLQIWSGEDIDGIQVYQLE